MAKLRRTPAEEPPKKINPLLEIAIAGVQFALMVIGIIGVAASIFRDGGLLERVGGKLMRMEFATLLIVIPLVLISAFVGRYWFEVHFSKSSSAVVAEMAMYAVMAIGVYHLLTYFYPALW